MNTIIVNTVKDQADINAPTVLTGYLLNGDQSVPLSNGNKEYRAIQDWIAEGNTPESAYTQQEIDDNTVEMTYQEMVQQLNQMTVEFLGHTFSGSQEQQAYVVSMLTKIEGDSPQATRNVYAIDGRTKVPMTKTNMFDFMDVVDVAQEAITDV